MGNLQRKSSDWLLQILLQWFLQMDSIDGNGCNPDRIGELIADLVMWSDVAKSSLWFGSGSFFFSSSCFAAYLQLFPNWVFTLCAYHSSQTHCLQGTTMKRDENSYLPTMTCREWEDQYFLLLILQFLRLGNFSLGSLP